MIGLTREPSATIYVVFPSYLRKSTVIVVWTWLAKLLLRCESILPFAIIEKELMIKFLFSIVYAAKYLDGG